MLILVGGTLITRWVKKKKLNFSQQVLFMLTKPQNACECGGCSEICAQERVQLRADMKHKIVGNHAY